MIACAYALCALLPLANAYPSSFGGDITTVSADDSFGSMGIAVSPFLFAFL